MEERDASRLVDLKAEFFSTVTNINAHHISLFSSKTARPSRYVGALRIHP